MKVETFGRYIVISRGFFQGTRWGCAFKVRITDTSMLTTTDLHQETICDETFDCREEAEHFALEQGRAEAYKHANHAPVQT